VQVDLLSSATVLANGVGEAGLLHPQVLDGLRMNSYAMAGVAVVGTGATYVSTATLDIGRYLISLEKPTVCVCSMLFGALWWCACECVVQWGSGSG
jgi:hypothetical protein